jgi:hypothetical protein
MADLNPVDAMTTDWKALRAGYEPGDGSMDGWHSLSMVSGGTPYLDATRCRWW